jgi:hypothetical protein
MTILKEWRWKYAEECIAFITTRITKKMAIYEYIKVENQMKSITEYRDFGR